MRRLVTAIALLALTLATGVPVRATAAPSDVVWYAPAGVRCPACPPDCGAPIVVVSEYEYVDDDPEWIDSCGFHHYHDTTQSERSYRCTECGHEWTVDEHAPPCACGWPGESKFPDCAEPEAAPQ